MRRVGELGDFLQGEEVNVVGRIDRLCDAEDAVCDGDAAAELGGIFDVVDEQGRGVQHCYDIGDYVQRGRRYGEEGVEGGDELLADVFSWCRNEVVIRAEQDGFLIGSPRGVVFVLLAVGGGKPFRLPSVSRWRFGSAGRTCVVLVGRREPVGFSNRLENRLGWAMVAICHARRRGSRRYSVGGL